MNVFASWNVCCQGSSSCIDYCGIFYCCCFWLLLIHGCYTDGAISPLVRLTHQIRYLHYVQLLVLYSVGGYFVYGHNLRW